ncbi:MAG: methyltransferase domain-containing protein [Methanomicrobia archaeon]|nr:methyltransferase domain-containing protein [Methanomicrobia archaeon]
MVRKMDFVKEEYRTLAEDETVRNNKELMELTGYNSKQLDKLPPDAIMGISCGNPTVECDLLPGMRTLDLGCGPGTDVLLCAMKVAPDGIAAGVDYVPGMVERAVQNAKKCPDVDEDNTDFRVGDLNAGINFPDNYFDYVTANCCLCLLDQPKVFREVKRVLKPGGYFVFSEVTVKKTLPQKADDLLQEAFGNQVIPKGNDVASKVFRTYIALAKGEAIVPSEILDLLKEAGFQKVKIIVPRHVPGTKKYPEAAKSAPHMVSEKLTPDGITDFKKRLDGVLSDLDINDFASFDTFSSQKPDR